MIGQRMGPAAVLLLYLVVLCRPGAAALDESRPNFVLFLADDLGWGDVGFHGNPTIRTANLDRMAARGMRFTNCYAGESICSPSRAALMTGRLPIRTGVFTSWSYPEDNLVRVFYPWSTGSLPPSEVTVANLVKPQGYSTSLVGKWHLGHVDALPTMRGFDHFLGLPYSQDEGCPPGYGMNCTKEWERIWPGVPLYRNDSISQQPVNLQTIVEKYTTQAEWFIEHSVNRSEPFVLIVAYDEVHIPLFASEKFMGKSKRGLFGDALMELDYSVGRIITKLEELGLDENTLMMFTSDNGPWVAQRQDGGNNGQFKGEKGTTFEGGVRMPTVAYWPGKIPSGSVNTGMASLMDIFPTVAELTGSEMPTDRVYDGVSLLPTMLGGAEVPRECYFFYRSKYLQAVRCGAFKAHLITRCGFCTQPPVYHDPPLLYNVQEDPGERFPLDPAQYEAVLERLQGAIAAHNETVVSTQSQLERLSVFVAPCCDRSTGCQCGHPDFSDLPQGWIERQSFEDVASIINF